MIGITVADKLDKTINGLNIDRLENHLIENRLAELFGIDLEDIKETTESEKIFKKFKSEISLDYIKDTYSTSERPEKNNRELTSVDSFSKIALKTTNENTDYIAIGIPAGIDVRLIYKNGAIKHAYVDNEEICIDIIDKIGLIVNGYLDELDGFEELEVDCIMIVEGSPNDKRNVIRFLVNDLTTADFPFNIRLLAYRISDGEPLGTEWEQLGMLEDSEFETVKDAMVRDVSTEDIERASSKMYDYILANSEYSLKRVDFMIDSEPDKVYTMKAKKMLGEEKYESVIKAINWQSDGINMIPVLEIEPVKTNNITVDKIKLSSLDELTRNENFRIGKDIQISIDKSNKVNIV